MTRGTRPVPRNLRLVSDVRDHPERRTHPANPIPEPPVSVPSPPEHLPAEEQEVFRERALLLAKMRVMTESDVDLLAQYSISYVQARKAWKVVWEKGQMLRSKEGNPYQNPYYGIALKADARCFRILIEFGLTPSSRNRVSQ